VALGQVDIIEQSESGTGAGSDLEFRFLLSVIIVLMLHAHCALFGQPAHYYFLVLQLRHSPDKPWSAVTCSVVDCFVCKSFA
jgi:hypothetical protein